MAAYARAAGAAVQVVEVDPVRRLVAHYDGYPTPPLDRCLQQVGIAVTATGRAAVIGVNDLHQSRKGLVLVNAGHGGAEIEVEGIKAAAEARDHVADHVVRYRLEGGANVLLLGDGYPLNIVTNAGSPEPVLLHFAVMGLALEWLTRTDVPPGEVELPSVIDREAASLALDAFGLAHG